MLPASPNLPARSPFVDLFRARSSCPPPSKAFLVGPRTLSYGEVWECTSRLGRIFDDREIAIGARGVIASTDDAAVAALFLGMLAAGVTAVILDPTARPAELQVLLAASEASILFLDDPVIERLRDEDAEMYCNDIVRIVPERVEGDRPPRSLRRDLEARPHQATPYPALLGAVEPALQRQNISADTAAYILFTSGTTSIPKGVEVSHASLFECYRIMCGQFGFDEGSRILNLLPLHHADGLSEGVAMTYFCGAILHRPVRFSLPNIPVLLEAAHRERITHFHATPTMLALIDRACEGGSQAFSHGEFRHVISSGGPLPESLWRQFESRFSVRIANVYGLTEAARELLYCGPDDASRRVGTNGKPIHCELKIVDAEGQAVHRGDIGELAFRAEHVMKGYFRRPDESAKVLRSGWIFTGDLAFEDDDGFVTVVGRRTNTIVTGGVSVYPEDVSRVICRMAGVLEAVTIGLPDEIWGERVVSCVVTERPGQPTVAHMMDYCRERVSRERVPSVILSLPELPRGASGKIALPEVKRLAAELLAMGVTPSGLQPAITGDVLAARVFELAAHSFKAPADEMTVDSEPETTVGWSSLAHMDFLLALEAAFDVRVAAGDMLSIVTLGDAIEFVSRQLAKRRQAAA